MWPNKRIDFTLGLSKRRWDLQGHTVVGIRANGCMASDHQFEWVGVVVSQDLEPVYGSPRDEELVTVRILYRQGDHNRDNLGKERMIRASLQQLAQGVWQYVH